MDELTRQRMSEMIDEHIRGTGLFPLRTNVLQILKKCLYALFMQRNHPFLASLADDTHESLLEMQLLQPQLTAFAHSQPAAIQHFEDRLVKDIRIAAAKARKEPLDLFFI